MGKFNLLLGIFLTSMFLTLGFCSSRLQASELLRYTFDDGTANDSVGSFHGSFLDGATVVNDPERGMVLSLDGTADAVAVPSIGSYSEFTIGMWMYSDVDLSGGQRFSGGYNTNAWSPNGVHFKYDYDVVNVGVQGTPDVTGTMVIPMQEWKYIAVTLSSTELAVYVDDGAGGIVKDNFVTLGAPISANLFAAQIGGWSGDAARYLTGMMDDVRIYDHALSLTELFSAMQPKSPIPIYPVDEENTGWDLTLEWSAPAEGAPTAYQVYLDPNLTYVNAAAEGVSGNPLFLNVTEPGLTYNVTNLAHGVRYYWKVEARYDPATTPPNDPNWASSFVATFTTLPDMPAIESQTAYQLVAEGEDAIFTVVSINADSYQWYKDGNLLGAGDPNYTGVTDSSLVVLAANLDDEGDYHCVLTNTAGDTPSVPASLIIKKLIGHWPFDGNLNDVVGGNHGSASDPNFVAGIVGSQAVKLTTETAVSDPVTIPTAAHTNTAWTLSWWEQSDLSQAGGNWETMIGNGAGADGWEVFEFGRYYSDRYAFGFNIGGDYLYTPDDARYPRGQWHHHVIAYDPDTNIAAWHINGVPFNSFTGVNFTAFDTEFFVGNVRGLSQPYPGNIDDLRLYNYPLDASEIAKLYTDVVGGWVCLEPIPVSEGDLNQDCVIDLKDFALFISEWLACGLYPPAGCP